MKAPLVIGLFALIPLVGSAAEPGPNAPKPFTLTPKAVPLRALQYPLLPELAEQTSGNAATLYRKAHVALVGAAGSQEERNEIQERLSKFLELPLKDFPAEEVRGILKPYAEAFKEAEAGARCETCDWEQTERLRKDGIGATLPELQDAREMALFLAVRARLELADGKPNQAVRTLRTGFALARHVGDSPTLIGALVGTAIANVMLERLEEVVQHEKAPNLYWSLSDLPSPFIDLCKGLQGERISIYGTLKFDRVATLDLDAGPMGEKELREAGQLAARIMIMEEPAILLPEVRRLINPFVTAQLIQARHEAAKKALIEQGRPREKVEAMPHLQVALLHACLQYDRQLDEMTKWRTFPYWQAREEVDAAVRRRKDEEKYNVANQPAIPLAKLLLPAVEKVFASRGRVDRRIAALRCVEAIRLYAAVHDGKLPAALGDIKEVPVPIDPATGKNFGYRLSGDKAMLSSPPLQPERTYPGNALSYEISLR
jgi:hypothetical protein